MYSPQNTLLQQLCKPFHDTSSYQFQSFWILHINIKQIQTYEAMSMLVIPRSWSFCLSIYFRERNWSIRYTVRYSVSGTSLYSSETCKDSNFISGEVMNSRKIQLEQGSWFVTKENTDNPYIYQKLIKYVSGAEDHCQRILTPLVSLGL